jgi:hypothetical protein
MVAIEATIKQKQEQRFEKKKEIWGLTLELNKSLKKFLILEER